MTIQEKLEELVNKETERIDKWYDKIVKRSHSWKNQFIRLLLEDISQLPVDPTTGNIIPGVSADKFLSDLRNRLPGILEDAGLAEYQEDLLETVRKRISTSNELWSELGIDSAKLSKEEMGSIPEVLDQMNNIVKSFGKGTSAADNALAGLLWDFRQSLQENESKSLKELISQLSSKAGILPRYAGTIANTSLVSIDRTLRKTQGERAGITTAKYMGALDSITRPFCRAHIGDILTWDVWKAMSNDTGPQPVSIYGGGYNCRHQLIPFDPEWSKEEWGKKPDKSLKGYTEDPNGNKISNDVNEFDTLHYTSKEAAESIKKNGFKVGTNNMYGEGVYFTNGNLEGENFQTSLSVKLNKHKQLFIENDFDTFNAVSKATGKPIRNAFDIKKAMLDSGFKSMRILQEDGTYWTVVLDKDIISTVREVPLKLKKIESLRKLDLKKGYDPAKTEDEFIQKAEKDILTTGLFKGNVKVDIKPGDLSVLNSKLATFEGLNRTFDITKGRDRQNRLVNFVFKSDNRLLGYVQQFLSGDLEGINLGSDGNVNRVPLDQIKWDLQVTREGKVQWKSILHKTNSSRHDPNKGDYTATHEFFHLCAGSNQVKVNNVSQSFFNDLKLIRKRYMKRMKELKEIADNNPEKDNLIAYVNEQISAYSHTNLDEFGAESFTEYMLTDEPNYWAVEVGNLFYKYFKKD